jgi:Na+-driven multidrug efflux pump
MVCVFDSHRILSKDFLHYVLPILGNELIWGVGLTMYSVILGHLGSDAVAANSVASTVRNLVAISAFGVAGAILIGKELLGQM